MAAEAKPSKPRPVGTGTKHHISHGLKQSFSLSLLVYSSIVIAIVIAIVIVITIVIIIISSNSTTTTMSIMSICQICVCNEDIPNPDRGIPDRDNSGVHKGGLVKGV